jgi:hypothetical protein
MRLYYDYEGKGMRLVFFSRNYSTIYQKRARKPTTNLKISAATSEDRTCAILNIAITLDNC